MVIYCSTVIKFKIIINHTRKAQLAQHIVLQKCTVIMSLYFTIQYHHRVYYIKVFIFQNSVPTKDIIKPIQMCYHNACYTNINVFIFAYSMPS